LIVPGKQQTLSLTILKTSEINILINGGDAVYDVAKLTYPAGEDLWQFWKWFRDQVKIPVFNCLGNHDIYEWEQSKEAIETLQIKSCCIKAS
jgi:DNA repair exonuclease SbcCD nuclease subunit